MSTALALCIVLGATRPQNPLDGDGMRLQCDGRKSVLTVRLLGIDAPEIRHYGALAWPAQPYSQEAADNLRATCPIGMKVTVRRRGTDRNGRALALVDCNGKDASETQASAGLAWVLDAPSTSKVPALVDAAKKAKKGLWADPIPVNPSVWRHPVKSC